MFAAGCGVISPSGNANIIQFYVPPTCAEERGPPGQPHLKIRYVVSNRRYADNTVQGGACLCVWLDHNDDNILVAT